MKRIIATALIAVVLISSCNDASKKDMSDATINIKEAGKDVKQAITATNDSAKEKITANWLSFKNESDSMIADMDKQVARLETTLASANAKEKENVKTRLNVLKIKLRQQKEKLQERNTAFENDMSQFNETVAEKTQSFEKEFKHDMNELGASLKDLFKDNVK